MESLATFSNALAGIVDALSPSVVRVEARGGPPASGIVWSAEGLVVTADHAIEGDEQIRVGLADGPTGPAALLGRDPTTDLAVLRAETGALRPPEWAEPDGARAGHLVLSLGRPGRVIRARLGMLSAVADDWRAPSGARIERYLQVDVGPAPGFSGGPVVGGDGRVLGLGTSGLLRRAVLAVPLPTVRRVVEALMTHGRVRRGYLGVGAQPVRLPSGLRERAHQEFGLLLVSVEPDSPADRAGLGLGDVLLDLGGVGVRHAGDLLAVLGADRIGAEVAARILRAGTVHELAVTIGERA